MSSSGQVLGLWVQNTSSLCAALVLASFLFFYLLFTLLVVRQTVLLNSLLKTQLAPLIYFLSLIHFFFGLAVLIFSLFYLRTAWLAFF